jgi:uncharacterized protein (TIGR03435 family)
MKKIATCVTAIVLFFATALAAQDITGTWQGTLHTPQKDLRTVWKFSKAETGGWKTVFYSIDQGGRGYPATSTALQANTLRCLFIAVGGAEYDGKLSADGKSIAGMWTQGPKPTPLVLERATPETEWTIPETLPAMKQMAADAVPVYEVSTIKPSKPGTPRVYGFGRRLSSRNVSLIFCMTWAYGLQARQIIGAPAWADTDKYDLGGETTAEGQPNDQQAKGMVRRLLEDRFKLKYHYEKREMPTYEIVVAKDGPKLNKSEEKTESHHYSLWGGNLTGYNFSIQDLGNILGRFVLDKPVLNKTGLNDRYDMMLKWTPDDFQLGIMGINAQPDADNADAPPGLFTAIQQQMGLKLQPGKIADVLVIDHVEKPEEN